MNRLLIIAAALAIAAGGCADIDPDPPLDEDGEPIETPGPFDRWLEVTAIEPIDGPLPTRPQIAVTFNDYIDDDSFRSYAFAQMRSGGGRAFGRARYVMTDKTVVWEPWSALEAPLRYEFAVTAEIDSATGAPFLAPAEWPSFRTDRDAESAPAVSLPNSSWSDVEPIFAQHCNECHRDEQWGLNPLTYASLVGQKSSQTDLYLVRPADPADSYLMRKLLWDYPEIEFTPQPPPWQENAEQLPREQLLIIEGWIASGAPR